MSLVPISGAAQWAWRSMEQRQLCHREQASASRWRVAWYGKGLGGERDHDMQVQSQYWQGRRPDGFYWAG